MAESGVVRAASLFVKGKMVAKIPECSYKIEDKSEQFYDANGHGVTKGAVNCSGSFGTIERVGAYSVDILALLLEQEKFSLSFGIVNGKLLVCDDVRVMSSDFKSNKEKGTLTGDFSWVGGKTTPR